MVVVVLTAFMATGGLMYPVGGGEAWSTGSGGCDCPAHLDGAFTLKPTDNRLDTGKRAAWGGGQHVVA